MFCLKGGHTYVLFEGMSHVYVLFEGRSHDLFEGRSDICFV